MHRIETSRWLPTFAMAAAIASTLALGAFVNVLFTPSDAEIRALSQARSDRPQATEVSIIPWRIDVTAARPARAVRANGAA